MTMKEETREERVTGERSARVADDGQATQATGGGEASLVLKHWRGDLGRPPPQCIHGPRPSTAPGPPRRPLAPARSILGGGSHNGFRRFSLEARLEFRFRWSCS